MRKRFSTLQKRCAHCGLPYGWRKALDDTWRTERYCSDRCRQAFRNVGKDTQATPARR